MLTTLLASVARIPGRVFVREMTPERVEALMSRAAHKEFNAFGVNAISIYHAYRAMQMLNEKHGNRLTKDRVLDILKTCAERSVSSVEHLMYGGSATTLANIADEINKYRNPP